MPRSALLVCALVLTHPAWGRFQNLQDTGMPLASGSLPAQGVERLRIICNCSAVVQGAAQSEIYYELRTRSRSRVRSTGRIRAVAGGGWATIEATPRTGDASEELRVRSPRSLREVRIETRGGRVETYDLDGAVQAETGGGAIQLDRVWGGADLRTAGGEIVVGTTKGPLRCTSGGGAIRLSKALGNATLDTAGGEITVGDVTGLLHAGTAGGSIWIGRAGSAVVARTAGGQIEVEQANSRVTATTTGGAIQIGAARGVRLDSGAGAIRVRNVSGAVRLSTAAGSILAGLLSSSPLEDSSITTGRGDVTVFIPSNLHVTVQALTEWAGRGGRIVSDFPEIRIRSSDPSSTKPSTARGLLNGGGPLLEISASGGSIFLRRQR